MKPGANVLTRTAGANALAYDFVMPRMAYFAAAYCGARAEPRTITVEPTWTMLPCPCFSIRSPNSWVMSSVPLTSMSMTASSASWVSSSQFICSLETSPTLLTSTSSVPNAAQTSSAIRLICVPRADVGLHEDAVAAGLADALERRFGARLRRAVVHGDLGALLRGADGDLGAEAGAGAGDEHGLAGEPGEDLSHRFCFRSSLALRQLGPGTSVAQTSVRPPSMYITWPVMKPAWRDDRNSAGPVSSSGVPRRPAGTMLSRSSRLPGLASSPAVSGVSM